VVGSGLDVVVVAVSIVSFEATLRRLRPVLLDDAHPDDDDDADPGGRPVFVDVLSVKEHPRRVLLDQLPGATSILCTHPMFGPDSGKDSWRDLPFVFDRVRILDDDVDRCERFLSVFEDRGCRMVELACRQHDVYAANSQFLTHLVGRMLGETGLSLRKTPIDTRGFESVLRLVETTCDDSFDLFYGLYRFNPHSKSTLLSLRKALADLELRLIDLELRSPLGAASGGEASSSGASETSSWAPQQGSGLRPSVSSRGAGVLSAALGTASSGSPSNSTSSSSSSPSRRDAVS